MGALSRMRDGTRRSGNFDTLCSVSNKLLDTDSLTQDVPSKPSSRCYSGIWPALAEDHRDNRGNGAFAGQYRRLCRP